MLFNKYDNGGFELRGLLGFIDADTNFDKWKTWIDLSVRQITELTGREVYVMAEQHYNSENFGYQAEADLTEETTPKASEVALWKKQDEVVRKFQLANALFAYVRLLPSLDAGHGNSGRKKLIGETERGLTAVEAYKDEANILNLAYEALEDLLVYLQENSISEWTESETSKITRELLIPDTPTFNRYYRIGSVRLYYTLVPMIKEVQAKRILPAITKARLTDIFTAQAAATPTADQTALIALRDEYVRPAMALLTMIMALKRLPVEVLPEGIVQTQITGTIKEKLIATESARRLLIQTLEEDASAAMNALEKQVEILNGAVATEMYVSAPEVNEDIKGFVI